MGVGSKSNTVERDKPVDGLGGLPKLAAAQGTGKGKPTEDRPAEGVPEPVATAAMLGELGREIECLSSKGEESVEGFLAVEKDASVEGAEVMFERMV